MSKKVNPADPASRTDTNPAHATGESHGKIKRPQRTDQTMNEVDLARGSEVECREGARQSG
ncbi:hypothetical protein [Novosphingobium sp.]|uniref:hypothetical protein n=1 Tax=Novosphingobium sp. TaxID=1874826 RepID=UPI00286E16F2|nr:hypothetical protein [Novosphingobium sp.]